MKLQLNLTNHLLAGVPHWMDRYVKCINHLYARNEISVFTKLNMTVGALCGLAEKAPKYSLYNTEKH